MQDIHAKISIAIYTPTSLGIQYRHTIHIPNIDRNKINYNYISYGMKSLLGNKIFYSFMARQSFK